MQIRVIIEEGHYRDTYIFHDADSVDMEKVLKPRVLKILNPEGTVPENDEKVESIRLSFDTRGEFEHKKDVLRNPSAHPRSE